MVDKHHIDNYNKHKTEVKYIIYLSNRKQKSYCFSKLNENSMPFGRKIQQNRRPARSGMINDMTCILQISVLHQNFHAASNVQKNKKEKRQINASP